MNLQYNTGMQWLLRRGLTLDSIREAGFTYCNNALGISPVLDPQFAPFVEGYFKDSVLIPMHDVYGRPLGLHGRPMYETDSKNISNGGFKKTHLLYGLHKSYKYILQCNQCIIVEGPFDFSMLWQYGIRNIVASLGVHVSWFQLGLLRRFTTSCILALDPDKAGRSATLKLSSKLSEYGITSSNFDLRGLDPDEYALKYGVSEFTKLNEFARVSLPSERGFSV